MWGAVILGLELFAFSEGAFLYVRGTIWDHDLKSGVLALDDEVSCSFHLFGRLFWGGVGPESV